MAAWRIRMAAAAFALLALPGAAAPVNPLTAERWRTRPLVIVAPDAADPDAAALVAARQGADRAGFAERDVVLYAVLAGRGTRDGAPLPPDATAALLAALSLRADGPETVVLVGKDGGVKARWPGAVAPATVFALIDGMPMRRQER